MESEGTGVILFFANYRYTPKAYQTLLVNNANAYTTKVKVKELKTLYKELSLDIEFIAARSVIYYDKKHSIGPTLKEGDKVYLLQKNIKTKQPSNKLDHKKLGLFIINKKTGL